MIMGVGNIGVNLGRDTDGAAAAMGLAWWTLLGDAATAHDPGAVGRLGGSFK